MFLRQQTLRLAEHFVDSDQVFLIFVFFWSFFNSSNIFVRSVNSPEITQNTEVVFLDPFDNISDKPYFIVLQVFISLEIVV